MGSLLHGQRARSFYWPAQVVAVDALFLGLGGALGNIGDGVLMLLSVIASIATLASLFIGKGDRAVRGALIGLFSLYSATKLFLLIRFLTSAD